MRKRNNFVRINTLLFHAKYFFEIQIHIILSMKIFILYQLEHFFQWYTSLNT